MIRLNHRYRAKGFTLIEVLIAIVILGVGLLGFALLQTMNVRFVQSANYRTQATNLTYELIDQMRANRVTASTYLGNYTATTEAANCVPATGEDRRAVHFKTAWECRLGRALGEGAAATVTEVPGDLVEVRITWGDERWVVDADAVTFTAKTRL